MSENARQILHQVLELPPIERAELLEHIFASFDFPPHKDIDRKWSVEAEDRINAYKQGKLKAKPFHEVITSIEREK